MKNLQKFSILFLLIPVLLSGSGYKKGIIRDWPQLRLVTQVDITCRHNNDTLSRRYTQPQKIEPVLNYLRLLTYQGAADTDPERITGKAYEIVLHYADGQQRIYRQKADRYLSKDNRPWEKIDPKQAALLYPLLQSTPSDL